MIILAQKACDNTRTKWDDCKVDDESERNGTLCFAAKLKRLDCPGVYRLYLSCGVVQIVEIQSRPSTIYTVMVDGVIVDV
jgi:hypothetical protein